jgi:hypothetical protein
MCSAAWRKSDAAEHVSLTTTVPAPTVRPPSRIAKPSPWVIATALPSSTVSSTESLAHITDRLAATNRKAAFDQAVDAAQHRLTGSSQKRGWRGHMNG